MPSNPKPGFENTGAGEGMGGRSGQAALNPEDASAILTDQDLSGPKSDLQGDTLSGAGPVSLDLEDEPGEFIRGEVDVKSQIDRTSRVVKANVHGHHDLDDSPEMTPGGIEEVAAKTDEDLARKGQSPHRH